VDPLSLCILFERLSRTDLDTRSQWLFRVALTVMYCTGLPVSVLASLGKRSGTAWEPSDGLLTFTRDTHPALAALTIEQAQVRIAPEIARQLRSVLGPAGGLQVRLGAAVQPLETQHIRCLLRQLGASDTVPVTMTMLRGAIWEAGRQIDWSPERLALASCSWDPAFMNDSRYLGQAATLDAQPLHEHMLRLLKHGECQLQAVKRGEAFASL